MELTEGCCSKGDSQGLPGCSNPRILGIPTIIFQYTLLLQHPYFYTHRTHTHWHTHSLSHTHTLSRVLFLFRFLFLFLALSFETNVTYRDPPPKRCLFGGGHLQSYPLHTIKFIPEPLFMRFQSSKSCSYEAK